MDREQAQATLRAYEPELKAIGVLSASVFGSVARRDAGPDSDVDVVVRLAGSFSNGGFDYFGRMDDLQRRLPSFSAVRLMSSKNLLVSHGFRRKSTGTAPLPFKRVPQRLGDILDNFAALIKTSYTRLFTEE